MYNGSKFRPTGEVYKTTNRYGETVYRDKFVPTTGYMKYLEEKREEEKQQEIKLLQAKLQFQVDKYGEVDSIDFAEYKDKMKSYFGIVIS